VDRHPSLRELADFLAGELSVPSRNRNIIRHLLGACPSCRERIRRLAGERHLPAFLRLPQEERPELPRAAFDYTSAFRAAERSLEFFFSGDRPIEEPPGVILAELGRTCSNSTELSECPSAERSALPLFTRWLVEKSHACRYADLDEMLQWALMARISADTCSAAIAGNAEKLADLRVRAEAQLANTLRVLGRSEEADATMTGAWRQLRKGTGDPLLRASLLQKSNSLLTLQGRYTAAFELIREANEIFRALGLKHEHAVTELKEAITCIQAGQPDRAAVLLENALPGLDPAEDAFLPLATRHALILSLINLGKTSDALAIYLETPNSKPDEKQITISLKLQWHEGKLLIALGMASQAEETLARVRSGFLQRRQGHELVLVTSDLIRAQRELGKGDAIRQEVAETTARVRAWRSGPEVVQLLDGLYSM
jgi:tetratricopeptide (TPR) repeat protein